jgi:23S rRNA (pseudouridine1915-N3)-methyltransferase
MKITILAVGKLKEKYWKEAIQEYLRRLSAYAKVELIEVPDRDKEEPTAECVQKREAADLLKRLPDGAYVIALDSGGKQLSSEGFAAHIAELALYGRSHLYFLIGGSTGLVSHVLARADETLSLGPQTWPHNLVRVMLTEQLYRACTINAGHPYHK